MKEQKRIQGGTCVIVSSVRGVEGVTDGECFIVEINGDLFPLPRYLFHPSIRVGESVKLRTEPIFRSASDK